MNKNFFLRTLHFYSALAILEPQIYGVVEHFLAENIPLLSGRLVSVTEEMAVKFPKVFVYCFLRNLFALKYFLSHDFYYTQFIL